MEHAVTPKLLDYFHARGKRFGLPVAGTFELTARCNFNCKMCYVHLTEAEQRRRGRELTAQEWIALGEAAKRAGTVFLLLTGGEPFLRPDFPEIYRALHRMGFLISINTNGALLNDELLELFREETPTRINVSLYGTTNATYQTLCGVPAYDRIVRSIERMRSAGLSVKLNLTLTPDNLAEMPSIIAEARALGAQLQATPYLFPPVRRDRAGLGENFRMSAEDAGLCGCSTMFQ